MRQDTANSLNTVDSPERMALMIFKPARTEVVEGRVRTTSKHAQWFVADPSKDFSTKYGTIREKDLKEGTVVIGSETFHIVPASFGDSYKSMRRKAQIITRKDLGFITGHCGITPESIVVESGAGSGGATLWFAKIAKGIFSYEIEAENIGVVKGNLSALKLSATITHADFYDASAVEEHGADLVLLDLPEPWRAYASAQKCSKLGAYIVAYTPTIVQAQRFVNGLPEGLLHERTCEIIDRDWKMQGDAVRPVSGDIGHTAFLTFVRRIA